MNGLFNFTDMRLFFRYRVIYPLFARLPYRWAFKCATLKGMINQFGHPQEKQAIAQGLKRAYPKITPAEINAIFNTHQRIASREIMDTYWLLRMTPQNIDQFIQIQGQTHLDQAIKTGRPVILCTGHFSRLMMPTLALSVKGYEIHGLISNPDLAPLPPQEVDFIRKKINIIEQVISGHPIYTSQYLGQLYRVLKRRALLHIAIDTPPSATDNTLELPFLAGKGRFSKGVVRLAKRVDALIVPYFAIETPTGLKGIILPYIETKKYNETELMAHLIQIIDQYIQQYPDQWWLWNALSGFYSKDN